MLRKVINQIQKHTATEISMHVQNCLIIVPAPLTLSERCLENEIQYGGGGQICPQSELNSGQKKTWKIFVFKICLRSVKRKHFSCTLQI